MRLIAVALAFGYAGTAPAFAPLLATVTQAQRLTSSSLWPELPARLEYRAVPVSATRIAPNDARFRLAAAGFPFRDGIGLTSRDRTLYSIAWINSLSSGRLRDGRGLRILPSLLAPGGPSEIRVAMTIELAGGYADRGGEINPTPDSHPDIPGYRFVVADSIIRRHFIGLWRRIRGPQETLIVSFRTASATEPAEQEILGRLPLRLNSIYLHGGLHIWYVNVISEARVGQPIYILNYELLPARTYLSPGSDPLDPPAH